MVFELMNTQEIHEFGLQVLLQHLTEKGFEIEFAQHNKSEIPHVVAKCQRRTVKNLKRRPENDPNAGNIALVIYAGTLSAGQLSAGSSAGGTGWTPAFHRSLSR